MNTCSVCGNSFEELCIVCLTSQGTCILCYVKFDQDDVAIQCNECLYLGHQANFKIWLENEGSCPVCKTSYDDDKFNEITISDRTIEKLYLNKSSIYKKRNEIFELFAFQYPFFRFQKVVVDDIRAQFQFNQSHLLISPPGSGKTIIALSLASSFSVHTLVLVPNYTIVGSWLDRLDMFYDPRTSKLDLQSIYSTSLHKLRPVTIITFDQLRQAIVEFHDPQTPDLIDHIDKSGDKYSIQLKSAVNFISRLQDHQIGFLIIDEVHRIVDHHEKEINELTELLGNVKILGLTATLSDNTSKGFRSIFSDGETRVPLPMLVREGVLVPYRDIVLPIPEDFKKFRKIVNFSPVHDFDFRHYSSLILYYLDKTAEEVKIINSDGASDYKKWLSANLSIKVLYTIFILNIESNLLKEDFRGLILLESENVPSGYNLSSKGVGGAIGLFNSLLEIQEIVKLDPVLLTGKSVLIHDQFLQEFIEKAGVWLEEQHFNVEFKLKDTPHRYSIIIGIGEDWNISTYTRLFTYMFEIGVVQLLIGSHYLLGEGWDSQTLNTLIDLTNFANYELVNQVKGRTLRRNPLDNNKVSHIWEVLPNKELTKYSDEEYEQFKNRHAVYFGIDEKGNIRGGIERLKLRYHSFNEGFILKFVRINNRILTKRLWKVGKALGTRFHSVRLRYTIPLAVSLELRKYVLQLIERSLRHLEKIHLQNPLKIKFEDEGNIQSQSISVVCYIQIEEDYNRIISFRDALLVKNPESGVGMLIEGYEIIDGNILKDTFEFLRLKYIDVNYHKHLIRFPAEINVKSPKEVFSDEEINDMTNFTIDILDHQINQRLNVKQEIVNFSFSEIKFFDFFIIRTTQYFIGVKGFEGVFPEAMQVSVLKQDSVILDQEYVDDY